MVKIALVVPHIIAGGMETYIFRLGAYLKRKGYDLTIVTTGTEGEWWARCESLGFATRAVLLRDSFNRITHISKVRRELSNYDVLLMNDARYAKAALPELPARIVAISVVHNDAHFAYVIGSCYPDLQDAVVGISPNTYDQLVVRTGRDKTVFIPHGVESATCTRNPFSLPVRLIYCGRAVQSHKNIFLLARICAVLRDHGLQFRLDFVGDGPDLAALKEQFKSANLETHVSYSGTLPHEEIYARLSTAHILLMPSFFEGFPLIPLEAQACGCVPVVSRLPGVTDLSVLEGVTGLLAEPANAESFAKMVLSLTDDPRKWRAMSDAGVQRIRDEFSVEKMGDSYCQLIERLCKDKQNSHDVLRPSRRLSPSLIGWTATLPNSLCRKLKIIE